MSCLCMTTNGLSTLNVPPEALRSKNMARNRPLFLRFPCALVPSPNQKRFFSLFKVSFDMMRESDSASADVEIRKPPKLHLSGAPDCPVEKPSVWSFFLRSIVHSSLIILILLFDRILGLPFALQAECPRSTSSIHGQAMP